MAASDALRVTVQLTLWERSRCTFAFHAGAKNPWQWAVSFLKNTVFASALFFWVAWRSVRRPGPMFEAILGRSLIIGLEQAHPAQKTGDRGFCFLIHLCFCGNWQRLHPPLISNKPSLLPHRPFFPCPVRRETSFARDSNTAARRSGIN